MRTLFILCFLALQLLGCDQLGSYEGDIQKSTQAISRAKNNLELSQGYSRRATAYSEKARYSHFRKLINPEQYSQLFDLSLNDHDKALELNPKSAKLYFGRGMSYYMRAAYVETPMGSVEIPDDPMIKKYFDLAMADFNKAIEVDAEYDSAFDMKGVIDMSYRNYDSAINNFTHVMKIKPSLGKLRLADAYCNRGSFYQRQKQYDEAISDYEKAIELHPYLDGCSCEPYNPLAWIYAERGEYAKGWEIVNRAKNSKVGIDTGLMEKLKTGPHH